MGVVREAFELDLREPCQVGEIRAGLAAAAATFMTTKARGKAGGSRWRGFYGSQRWPCLKMRLLFL